MVKRRVYQQGDDWMVELQSIPPAPIRYTMDGASPRNDGTPYEGPFPFVEGSPFVLAIADSKGVYSDEEKIDVDQFIKKEVKLDPAKKVKWNRGTGTVTAKLAFDLLNRLERFKGSAFGVQLDVYANNEKQDVTFTVVGDVPKSGKELSDIVASLQQLVGGIDGAQISLAIESIHFEKGQDLIDWVADAKIKLQPGEAVQ